MKDGSMKTSSLLEVQETKFQCQLCGEKFKRAGDGREHATLGVQLPDYHIGDRVRFKIDKGSHQFVVYQEHEGTIMNLMLEKDWLTEKYPLNSEHDTRYLFGYQIREDNGHVYEECWEVQLIQAAPQTETYEGGKKVFTPKEFREEMKRDPRWKDYVTPRHG